MTTQTSADFRTNSGCVSSEKLDKTVSSQMAGSGGSPLKHGGRRSSLG